MGQGQAAREVCVRGFGRLSRGVRLDIVSETHHSISTPTCTNHIGVATPTTGTPNPQPLKMFLIFQSAGPDSFLEQLFVPEKFPNLGPKRLLQFRFLVELLNARADLLGLALAHVRSLNAFAIRARRKNVIVENKQGRPIATEERKAKKLIRMSQSTPCTNRIGVANPTGTPNPIPPNTSPIPQSAGPDSFLEQLFLPTVCSPNDSYSSASL